MFPGVEYSFDRLVWWRLRRLPLRAISALVLGCSTSKSHLSESPVPDSEIDVAVGARVALVRLSAGPRPVRTSGPVFRIGSGRKMSDGLSPTLDVLDRTNHSTRLVRASSR